MKIYNNVEQLHENYYFYEEDSRSNLLGSSVHMYNFRTRKELRLKVDYSESFYKLVLCIDGYSETYRHGRLLYAFKSGKALLYRTLPEHYDSILKADTNFKVIHLHFSDRLAAEITALYRHLFKKEMVALPVSPAHIDLLHRLGQPGNAADGLSGLLLEKVLLEQLCRFAETFSGLEEYHTRQKQADVEKIHEARRILDHSGPFVTTAQLAREVGVNVFKMKKLFKELYHKNIFEYQVDNRMTMAHRLLLDTDIALEDIALQCGYQSPGSFSNAFKRKFGLRPSAVRKY